MRSHLINFQFKKYGEGYGSFPGIYALIDRSSCVAETGSPFFFVYFVLFLRLDLKNLPKSIIM